MSANETRFAMVTQLDPYQVQLLGESAPLNIEPVVLTTVNVGEYVWCQFFDQQLVVFGRVQDGALPQLGSTEDLNNFGYTGTWGQPLSANTSTAHNYPPSLKSGILEVIRSDVSGGMIHQRYSVYDGTEVWWRVWSWQSGAWSTWLQTASSQPTWTAMTLTNSWANYGSGFAPAQYWKSNGIVYAQGLIKSGTVGSGTPFFTFPAGYRPAAELQFTGNSSGGVADLRVLATGAAYVYSLYSGTNASVSIANIRFPAEQ